MPAISIICPVYKAEEYLHRCVDSILAQTFTDFELLLINDGSPDKSGIICNKYAQMDSRVKVFHKENGGVASARQCGLDNAQGEYTIHADPDDWVEPTMLEELYAKTAEANADMVICDFYEEYKHKQIYRKQEPNTLITENILRQVLDGSIHGAVWNKLIRRECFNIYNIRTPNEILFWEDRYVTCRLLMHNIKVAYLNKAFYHYDLYSNDNSIVRSVSLKSLNSQIYFITYFEKHLDVNKYANELYLMKASTKDRAFCCQEYSFKQFKKLYSEINHQYKRYLKPWKTQFYGALALLIGNKKIPFIICQLLKKIKL